MKKYVLIFKSAFGESPINLTEEEYDMVWIQWKNKEHRILVKNLAFSYSNILKIKEIKSNIGDVTYNNFGNGDLTEYRMNFIIEKYVENNFGGGKMKKTKYCDHPSVLHFWRKKMINPKNCSEDEIIEEYYGYRDEKQRVVKIPNFSPEEQKNLDEPPKKELVF